MLIHTLEFCLLPAVLLAVGSVVAMQWALGSFKLEPKVAMGACVLAVIQVGMTLPSCLADGAASSWADTAYYAGLTMLPFPMLYLLGWHVLKCSAERAHEALGVAFPFVLVSMVLALFSESNAMLREVAAPAPFLYFITIYLVNAATTARDNPSTPGRIMVLTLAQMADCLFLYSVGAYLLVDYLPAPNSHSLVGAMIPLLIGLGLVQMAVSRWVWGCTWQRSVLAAMSAVLLLPLLTGVAAMVMSY